MSVMRVRRNYGRLKKHVLMLLLGLAVIAGLGGCNVSRLIPDGQYLLESVEVRSDNKDVDGGALRSYVRQRTNSKWFSLFKIPLATYSLAGTDTAKWINRTLRRMGKAPVLYDSVQACLSLNDLTQAMRNMGYMHASADLETEQHGKRLKAIYNLHPGQPYYISRVDYDIDDPEVEQVLNRHDASLTGAERKTESVAPQDKDGISSAGRLTVGERFSVDRLDSERKRITKVLMDSGYYKFHRDFIYFTTDSSRYDNQVGVTLHLDRYRTSGDSILTAHPRYRIGDIRYLGGEDGKIHLRQSTLEYNTALESGEYFDASDLQRTYNNFGRLQAVRYTNIQLNERPDAHVLDADIQVSTNKPSTISFEPEGTNTAGDLGAAASLTYSNRNLFKGSELLSLELRGAFEAITGLEGYRDENYEEYGVEARLQFPRMLAPFLSRDFKRRSTATSELAVSWDLQNRPEFHRRVFSTSWRYQWSEPQHHTSYRFDVLNLNYVYMPWISETFKHDYLDSVSNRNAILRYNYEDLFIMRTGFGITYNNGVDALRANIETAGNLLQAIAKTAGFRRDEEGRYTLFNIAYAEYIKFDFDYTHLFRIDQNNTLALHGDFGIAWPYGNSDVLPFEKRYFSGGANSVRGWSVRELGPGSFRGTDGRIDFINHTGDVKLDLNAELRTYLFWKFNGAVFIDAGNIWTLRDYPDQPGGQFKLNEFYKQIAVAYGLGLRLNFDYFILRFDFGMKAINPAYLTEQEHWAIFHPRFSRDFTFHFAVGMPF